MLQEINIESMIYEVRGKQVMLDSDLAKLYNVQTFRINEAVKNNPEKFPERFCFRISDNEINFLISKKTISKKGGSRKGHNVFTEQGIWMLSTILKSKEAIKVTIMIMDTFVSMRKFINKNIETFKELDEIKYLTIQNTNDIKLLQESFDKLEEKEKINHIFFKGQIYDAYSLLVDILNTSKEEIIIIDNYIDKTILDIISLLEKKVTIITNKYNNIDIEKYKKQYDNLEIIINNSFHDRFIIIDRKVLYHCGASFKDIGSKCFSINQINDNEYLEKILKNTNIFKN